MGQQPPWSQSEAYPCTNTARASLVTRREEARAPM